MRLAGHCVRHPELSACDLILWEPTQGQRSRGRPQTTCVDTLRRDTGLCSVSELQTLMEDRDQWRAAIKCSRVGDGWHPRIARGVLEYEKICTDIHFMTRKVCMTSVSCAQSRGCWDCHISIIVNDFRNSLHMTRSHNTTLKRDTGATNVKELACLMEERTVWRKHVGSRLTKSTQWVRNHGRLIWRQHNHNPKLPIHIGYETYSYH